MNWEKLTKKNYFAEPVEHIHSVGIFDSKEYDKLYENQNNLKHKIWTDFDEKYKIRFEFIEDIRNIKKDKEVIALWFFRERADTNHPPQIDLAGRLINYYPNSMLITQSKDIKIKLPKRMYIRTPFIQLDLNIKKYLEIIEKIR